MGAGTTVALIKALGTKTEQELEEVKSAINGLDETINGGQLPPVIVMPEGYKSANYQNGSATRKFKWENNKLVLKHSNGQAGETNTGDASLTIGDTLEFDVVPANNANESKNLDSIEITDDDLPF